MALLSGEQVNTKIPHIIPSLAPTPGILFKTKVGLTHHFFTVANRCVVLKKLGENNQFSKVTKVDPGKK